MFKRSLSLMALALVLVVPAIARAAEGEKKSPPTVVVRAPSVDDLMASARQVAAASGQEEILKQFEQLLKAMTGLKGIEGFDPKKPVGAYGRLEANLPDSSLVVLLPVADEESVLAFVQRAIGKTDLDKNGVYSVTPEKSPTPIYFCFADGYVYASNSDRAVGKDQRLAPRDIIANEPGALLSVQINFKEIPDKVRDGVLDQVRASFGKEKDKKEGESKAEHAFRSALLDEIETILTQLLKEGDKLSAKVTVDPKTSDPAIDIQLTARDDTTLAKRISAIGDLKSVFGALPSKSSSLLAQVNVVMPEKLKKAFGPLVEEQMQKGIEAQNDEVARELLRAFIPTLKEATLDAAVEWQGPSEKKLYTIVMALRVKDGLAIDKALREAKLKPEQKLLLTFDAEKADKIAIHRANVGAFYDDNVKGVLGETPVYFAFRDDAVFLSAGENGLTALKGALKAKEAVAPPLKLRLSLNKLAAALGVAEPRFAEAAKEAFAKDAGRDQVELSLTGGKTLQLRLDVQAPVLRFLVLALPEQKK